MMTSSLKQHLISLESSAWSQSRLPTVGRKRLDGRKQTSKKIRAVPVLVRKETLARTARVINYPSPCSAMCQRKSLITHLVLYF